MISKKEAPKENTVVSTNKSEYSIDQSVLSNATCPGRIHNLEKNKLEPEIKQLEANSIKSDNIDMKNKVKTKKKVTNNKDVVNLDQISDKSQNPVS